MSTRPFRSLKRLLPSARPGFRSAFGLRFSLAIGLLLAGQVQAHEFWLVPAATPLVVGQTARLTLQVGEFFEGQTLPFAAAQTVSLRQYTAAGSQDLLPLLALRSPVPSLAIALPAAGTHLVVFDSQPNVITLPADRFHAYLHDEGLDAIKTRREADGTAAQPGRERYRRFVKTLFRASNPAESPAGLAGAGNPAPDQTFAVRTGQQLEVLPLNDPLALAPGGALGVQVLFVGQPLAGALVKAWHRRGAQTLIIRATTQTDGKAQFELPYAGAWMVSVVHMVPAVGVKGIDWDSLWGNLSFSLAGARPGAGSPAIGDSPATR